MEAIASYEPARASFGHWTPWTSVGGSSRTFAVRGPQLTSAGLLLRGRILAARRRPAALSLSRGVSDEDVAAEL